MRTHGTLTQWNEDRGFGFIAPAQGHAELFVHISAFPRDGKRPQVGELVSFETEAGAEGKSRAVRVMRPGGQARSRAPRPPAYPRQRRHHSRWRDSLVAVLVVAAIGSYTYVREHRGAALPLTTAQVDPAAELPAEPDQSFHCDGRTMCSQMTSCAEATYFLQHCPSTKMDGNNDGEPCEQQWCN
ncbi:MAG: cold shock domain-containing protein [Luteimonas sp.]